MGSSAALSVHGVSQAVSINPRGFGCRICSPATRSRATSPQPAWPPRAGKRHFQTMKAPIKKNNTNSTAASCLRDAPTPGKSPRSLGKGFREGSEDFCAKTPFGSPIPWPCSRAGAALPRPSWGSAPKPVPAPGARGKSPKPKASILFIVAPGQGRFPRGRRRLQNCTWGSAALPRVRSEVQSTWGGC